MHFQLREYLIGLIRHPIYSMHNAHILKLLPNIRSNLTLEFGLILWQLLIIHYICYFENKAYMFV